MRTIIDAYSALAKNGREVGETIPGVRQTSKSKLKQIDFRFEGRELRGLEQNPNTKSRWAKWAREGKAVMQFLDNGRYVAVVADGKVHFYKPTAEAFRDLSRTE